MSRRFKPTKPKHFWTRALLDARKDSTTSLHQNRSRIRTWLYFKLNDIITWGPTVPVLFQYQASTMAMNAPADEDPVTAGLQMPTTFPTLCKIYGNYLNDVTHIKQNVILRNLQPTGSVQATHLLTMSWFDYSASSATVMNQLAASAPTLTPFNLKERIRQIFTMQYREHYVPLGSGQKRIGISRKFSLRNFFGHNKADYQSPIIDPLNPTSLALAFNFFGTGNLAPANPLTIVYHHFVVLNLGAMIDAFSVWPIATNTQNLVKTDLAHYVTFYNPLNYAGPLNI